MNYKNCSGLKWDVSNKIGKGKAYYMEKDLYLTKNMVQLTFCALILEDGDPIIFF